MKKQFILDEIWMLTIYAAFQRANIYPIGVSEKNRNEFRYDLKRYVVSLSQSYIKSSVNEMQHIENIKSISKWTTTYSDILTNGSMNFGACQKLLNLYLKYLWCLDFLDFPPPHFPVDRIIQAKLGITQPIAWTKMDNESDYLDIIEKAKQKQAELGLNNISELELHLFNRRNI